jgi:hypothetical protein
MIFMPCHWRTGSTLLKTVFEKCGMLDCYKVVGHDGEFEYSVDNVGWQFYYKGYSKEQEDKARRLLNLFRESCEKLGRYGIKVSHAIQGPSWQYLQPVVEECWPDVRYVISIRHPWGIVRSIDKLRKLGPLDPPLPVEDILASWKSTFLPTKELIEKGRATIVVFPDDFISGRIKSIPKQLGLRWNKSANIFDHTKFDVPSEEEKEVFEKQYPISASMFKALQNAEFVR